MNARATYLVAFDSGSARLDALLDLATYLSEIKVAGFEVIVLDRSPAEAIEQNRRVLRWVGRYLVPGEHHRHDPIRAALDIVSCEKVIIARACARFEQEALDTLCAVLETHDVVRPQDYFAPLPWWGGIDAARNLVQRGTGGMADPAPAIAVRRSAVRGLRGLETLIPESEGVSLLGAQAVAVHAAEGVFVRRVPPLLADWFRERPLRAESDFDLPHRAAFYCSLLPLFALVTLIGGVHLAAFAAAAVAFVTIGLAVRGWIGVIRYFPFHACLLAPLALVERSISLYWALLRKFSGAEDPRRIAVPQRDRNKRAVGD